MILLQILSTSMIVFLKPSLKSILQIVKQDYYDYSSTSMIEFLKPSLKWILQIVQ